MLPDGTGGCRAVCAAPSAAGFSQHLLQACGITLSPNEGWPGAGMWSLVAGAGEEPCWNMLPLLGCGCDLGEVREPASGVLLCSCTPGPSLVWGAR